MKQLSFIDLFIDLFESVLHVSGDKLAHIQEHFWLNKQFWYNAPILLPTGDFVTLSPVGSNVGALYQNLYIQSKVLLKMGEFVARNM